MDLDLDLQVLLLTVELYSRLNFSRNDVTFIINLLRNFLSNTYNPFLLGKLNKYLDKAIDDESMNQINKTFKEFRDPLKNTNLKTSDYVRTRN